jgi:CheY-like chemotaxis protein/HPt (histidine-containing phosphotransfer) domain-containing protein
LNSGEQTRSDSRPQWHFPPARILVVDDGDENRELLRVVLNEMGLHMVGAENGQVGVEKALGENFDIILMDVQMPVMDGFTATRQLRLRRLETPIIALTAHAMKGFHEEIMAVGFSGYLTKPIDIDALIKMLADLLGARRADIDVKEKVVSRSEVNDQARAAEVGAEPPLVSRLPASNPRFRPIIEKFTRRLGEQLDAMTKAWNERNFDEIASLAHWLKGAGGTVGFDAFTEPAAKLEQFAKSKSADQVEQTIVELRRLADRVVVSSGEDALHAEL